jgi:hypothetical protein
MGALNVLCDDKVEANFQLSNFGETVITSVQYQVIVNGQIFGTFTESVNIPYQGQEVLMVEIDDNLVTQGNAITVNILNVNNQTDGTSGNNSASGVTNLESDYDIITLVINADNYPQETSWEIYDLTQQRIVDSGTLNFNT